MSSNLTPLIINVHYVYVWFSFVSYMGPVIYMYIKNRDRRLSRIFSLLIIVTRGNRESRALPFRQVELLPRRYCIVYPWISVNNLNDIDPFSPCGQETSYQLMS